MKYFDELSNICINAAEQSLTSLQKMKEEGLLSTILVADFYYALDTFQIFLIAHALDKQEKHVENVRKSLEVLQSMGSSGYCQNMLPEVLNQVKSWGILDGPSLDTTEPHQLETSSFMDVPSGNDLYEMYVYILLSSPTKLITCRRYDC